MSNIERFATMYINNPKAPADPWLLTFGNVVEEFESCVTNFAQMEAKASAAVAYKKIAKRYVYNVATEQIKGENPAARYAIVDRGSRRYVVVPKGIYQSIEVCSHTKNYRVAGPIQVSERMLVEVEGPSDIYRDSFLVAIQDGDGNGFLIEKPAGSLGRAHEFFATYRCESEVYPRTPLPEPIDELRDLEDIKPTEVF